MILYHGTNEKSLPAILQQGIKPRSDSKPGNWLHTIESNPTAVYLSNAYALYFAFNASDHTDKEDRLVVLEIDTKKLKAANLCADEDVVAQANVGQAPEVQGMNLIEATRYYREHIHTYDFKVSLDRMGTCGYRGTIPTKAIKRIALVDQKVYLKMMFIGHDPSISLANYMVCGDKYRDTLKWLFDPDSVTVEETRFGKMVSRSLPVPETREGIEIRLPSGIVQEAA